MEYLVRFAQVHESFRLPELRALATLANVDLDVVYYEESRPFCVVRLPCEDAAKALIGRSILAQAIYELWGTGQDFDTLRNHVKVNATKLNVGKYGQASFRFRFDSFQGKHSKEDQRELIESFSFLDLSGPIRMNDAELRLCVFEYFRWGGHTPDTLYLGRWLADSNRNAVVDLDLKKRRYIGLTSMDAELSLVAANMTHAAPGRVIYDPFVGTGSFSIACAHFGAAALGSDIDGRNIRGTSSCNHLSNFDQYHLASSFFDNFIADITNTPLRVMPWLHGMICDPPYGVREGPRVLGYRDDKDTTPVSIDGVEAHMRPGWIPPKRPYGFDDMLQDILDFAVVMLVPNGRLSMWMPIANEDNVELTIPTSPGLELVSVCVQHFNKWARRLMTYSRLPNVRAEDAVVHDRRERIRGNANDLNRFRKMYFQGFQEPSDAPV